MWLPMWRSVSAYGIHLSAGHCIYTYILHHSPNFHLGNATTSVRRNSNDTMLDFSYSLGCLQYLRTTSLRPKCSVLSHQRSAFQAATPLTKIDNAAIETSPGPRRHALLKLHTACADLAVDNVAVKARWRQTLHCVVCN